MLSKNRNLNWDDLRLFLAVAEAGGLTHAAAASGSSAPTLNRRMRHLELNLGLTLFERHHAGYELTAYGQALLERVTDMAAQMRSIQTWREELDHRFVVRVTAGAWTSAFLAKHLDHISNHAKCIRIELLTGANLLNLSRHEADIGIRNKVPDQQGLARKRIGPVSFAIYGAKGYCKSNPAAFSDERYEACEWVSLSRTGSTGTSSYWLRQQIGDSAKLMCATPHAMLEAAVAGVGLCVLPCFIGASDHRLEPCSAPLENLGHTQWLVTHDASRDLPHIREVSRRILRLFDENQKLFG